jgi:hypothetical protein
VTDDEGATRPKPRPRGLRSARGRGAPGHLGLYGRGRAAVGRRRRGSQLQHVGRAAGDGARAQRGPSSRNCGRRRGNDPRRRDRGSTVAPLSRDRQAQATAIDRLDAFGTTGLHDAIVAAIAAVQPARGRRALILLSDGDDRYSQTSAAEALQAARQSDVMIYPVALGQARPPLFAELSTLTGGRSFHVRDGKGLRTSCAPSRASCANSI